MDASQISFNHVSIINHEKVPIHCIPMFTIGTDAFRKDQLTKIIIIKVINTIINSRTVVPSYNTSTLTMSSLHSLLSNPNIDDKYDDIKLLIDTDRSVLQSTDNQGRLPIHVACDNPHVTLRIIQLLLDSWPESVSRTWTDQNNQIYDYLPIHCLCANVDLHETVSIDILNTLIEASPESVRHGEFELPIHMAARAGMSFKFIKIRVHEYPESVSGR